MSMRAASIAGTGPGRGLGRLVALGSVLMLGACAQVGDIGLGLGAPEPEARPVAAAAPTSELERATEYWGKELAKNPRDSKAGLSYARNLKALGRKPEALGVLQASYLHNSDSKELLSEYGRLALDMGQVGTAAPLLERADDPAKPDWRIISARGTVLAKQGRYKDAIGYYERARALAPAQASIVNNLAMAYTMDGQAAKAEGLLRQAAEQPGADPRVQQNLALVMGLQGKGGEGARSDEGSDGAAATRAVAEARVAPPAGPAAVGRPAVLTRAPALAKPEPSARAVEAATAPVAPVAATPLDADAIIKAALEADAAKTRKVATNIATGSALPPKPAGSATAGGPALRPTTR